MLVFSAVWILLAVVVVALATMRKFATRDENDCLHVSDVEVPMVAQQLSMVRRLERIDKWGKTLTAVVVIYGIALLAGYLYVGWQDSQNLLK